MTTTAAASAPNHDGLLLLEAPYARVPHDELRRYLRIQQRFIERDLTYCSTSLESLSKSARSASSAVQSSVASTSASVLASSDRSMSTDDRTTAMLADETGDVSIIDTSLLADVSFASEVRGDTSLLSVMSNADGESGSLSRKSGTELERSLDVMIGRIKGLKRKLTSVHETAGSTLARLDTRTSHLDALHKIQSTAAPAFEDWCRTRLDRMLVDWMLRKGYAQSAELLVKNRNLANHVDLTLFAEIARIEASLAPDTTSISAEPAAVPRTCAAALAWCSENKAALRKIRSTLEFDLRLQEFIELTRLRTSASLHEAILYARKHLLPYLVTSASKSDAVASTVKDKPDDNKDEQKEQEQLESIRKQVARAMGLLACGPMGWSYEDLYHAQRWPALQTGFRKAALQIHSLPPQPLLHIALGAGLSSLKLPACYSDDTSKATAPPAHLGGRAFGDERSNLLSMAGVTATSTTAPPLFPPAAGLLPELGALVGATAPPSVVFSPAATTTSAERKDHTANDGAGVASHMKNDNCPVCETDGLGVLAKEVPWSHHINSTLVCAISGRIMDENNPPMALPNGRVYSLTALQEMATVSQDGDTVHCPRTGASFPLSSARKVYIS